MGTVTAEIVLLTDSEKGTDTFFPNFQLFWKVQKNMHVIKIKPMKILNQIFSRFQKVQMNVHVIKIKLMKLGKKKQ